MQLARDKHYREVAKSAEKRPAHKIAINALERLMHTRPRREPTAPGFNSFNTEQTHSRTRAHLTHARPLQRNA
ncbi:MAG: hypothetical protein JF591_07440 [Lysobacter sp.]|nr:hypothetical protein [Lysobacter sp.]